MKFPAEPGGGSWRREREHRCHLVVAGATVVQVPSGLGRVRGRGRLQAALPVYCLLRGRLVNVEREHWGRG
jgi:hypothetical protein